MALTAIDAALLGLVLVGGLWGLVVGALRVAGPLAVLVALLTLVHAYPDLSTRLGAHPTVGFFLPLLAGFVGVVALQPRAHVAREREQLPGLHGGELRHHGRQRARAAWRRAAPAGCRGTPGGTHEPWARGSRRRRRVARGAARKCRLHFLYI